VWVRQIAIPSAVEVVPPGTDYIIALTFTPDGSFLDYTAETVQRANGRVFQVPVLGGTPRLLVDHVDTGVSFSPDASRMTFATINIETSQIDVSIANADGSGAHKLASYPGSVATGDYAISWSPDGKRIVAAEKTLPDPHGLSAGLIEIDASSGAEKPLPGRHWREIRDFVWLPDGSGLLMASLAKSGADMQLWIVSYPGGEVRRVSNDLSDYLSVAVSSDARFIASVQRNMTSDIWISPANSPEKAQQVTSGRLDGESGMAFTPDDRIVYTGNHSQNWDLFISDINGDNSRQLSFEPSMHSAPAVCEGGKSVVYYSNAEGQSSVWKLDLQSGNASRLVTGPETSLPTCGVQSDTVFFWQRQGETSNVFKIPISGGTPTRFSDRISISPPFASLDGRHVMFATPFKKGTVGAAIYATDSGKLEEEADIPPTFDVSTNVACWMPDNHTAAFSDLRSGVPNLWSVSLLGEAPQKQITNFTSGKVWSCAYSPDGKYLGVARGSRQSDAVLFTSGK
jgi:Tol biopolymer transport system component